jgi:flagellar assembly protein FliH
MATSPLIPKEQLAGIQRWEFGSFDGPRNRRKGESIASAAAAAEAAAASAQRVRELTERARAEAYTAGHREGLEASRTECNTRIARVDQLLQELSGDLARFDRELANEVVQLALAVAKKMVGAALTVNPDAVRESVEEALRQVAHFRGPVTLAVNPEDAALVRTYLETAPPQNGWAVREDPLVAAGGCRVETSAGEVDATLESRWHRITTALGQPLDWIKQ